MNVRYPAVAGTFYPSEKSQLSGTIQSFLDKAPLSQKGELVGFIVPDAGYIVRSHWRESHAFAHCFPTS